MRWGGGGRWRGRGRAAVQNLSGLGVLSWSVGRGFVISDQPTAGALVVQLSVVVCGGCDPSDVPC